MSVTTRALTRAIAVGAGITLLLTGCGGSEEPTASPSETSTSEPAPSESETGAPERADADLVIWADQKRADALTDIAEAFGEENGITVAVQVVSLDLQTNFVTANTAKNGPDIVIGAHDWIGNLVQNSAIEAINLPEADQAEYSDIALKGVTYEGNIYGLPYAVESIGLYRNTDLVPDEPADLDAAIAAATASGAANPLCLQVGENGDAYHMQPLYSSAGGYLFGTNAAGDYDPTDLGVGKPGSIAAAAKISELGKAGVLKTSITGDNSISTFTAGECAMLVSGPWALADIQKAGINYALGPVPGFAGMAPGAAVHRRPGVLRREQRQEQVVRRVLRPRLRQHAGDDEGALRRRGPPAGHDLRPRRGLRLATPTPPPSPRPPPAARSSRPSRRWPPSGSRSARPSPPSSVAPTRPRR